MTQTFNTELTQLGDFFLGYLGVIAGMLTLFGVISIVYWAFKIWTHLKGSEKAECISPPESDPKDAKFKTSPTPEQIRRALRELDDQSPL